jgi:hypothetical protein
MTVRPSDVRQVRRIAPLRRSDGNIQPALGLGDVPRAPSGPFRPPARVRPTRKPADRPPPTGSTGTAETPFCAFSASACCRT